MSRDGDRRDDRRGRGGDDRRGRREDGGRGGEDRRGRGGDERRRRREDGDRRGRREDGGRDGQRRDAQGRTRNRGISGGPRRYSQQAPSARSRRADPARAVAFEVLRAVHEDDAYANLVLPGRIRSHRLDRRDAAFATELTYGTLREQGLLDAVLAECVDRPLEQIDAPVLDALRLGAQQLLHLRVPAHAALDATVALVRDRIGAGPSGFVNAVLRRVSETPREEWIERIGGAEDTDAGRALRHSHPTWIVRALRQSLVTHGYPAEQLDSLLEADNAAPVVNLVALPGLGDLGPVLEAGAEPGPLAPGSALHAGGDSSRIPGVPEGTVRVQDVGSQLTARALAAVDRKGDDDTAAGRTAGEGTASPENGAAGESTAAREPAAERWLDLCAGPGGKAALLAALAAERGAVLLANEVAEHRAELVRKALAPVPDRAWSVRAGDGRTLPQDHPAAFDRILVDAPCTGLGALRRRPESRWRRTPADLADLTGLQSELLDAAVAALAPGGVLAYVTCSPHPAETAVQVEDLLARHPELEQLDAWAALDAVSLTPLDRPAEPGPTAQLFPHLHGTDAMFLALFRAPKEA